MRLATAILSTFLLSSTALAADKATEEPLKIVVSLSDQRMTVYEGETAIAESNISSGKKGHATPTGVFSILQKRRHHRSNIYSGAPMPFMQRLTWSGIALHASNSVPRRPASHGCVRLPHSFARKLFSMSTRGAHVIIEHNPQAPRRVSHAALFQPAKTWQPDASFDAWVNARIEAELPQMSKAPEEPIRILITRRTHKDDLKDTQRLLNKLGHNEVEADGFMGPVTWGAITAFQESVGMEPDGKITAKLLDILYTKAGEKRPANGRLLVRQHLTPIFEAEVEINDPEKPLGSHIVSTTGFDAEAEKTGWMAISLEDRVHRRINMETGEVDESTARRSLSEALERIEISDEVRRTVAKMLRPGSSLAISDNGLSGETGEKGTDFIVLTKPDFSDDGHVAGTRNNAQNS